MKKGDLVDFHTDAWVFQSAIERYANPGVILSVKCTPAQLLPSAEVYWADGRITTEHVSYLRPTVEQISN